MNHGRLPWLGPGDLGDEQRAFYDLIASSPRAASMDTPLLDEAGRFHGPFNQMLTHPALGVALDRLGHALRFPGSLPRAVFESVVVTVASARRAGYEWYAHAPLARAAGVSAAQLAAVFDGDYEALAPTIGPATVRLVRDTLENRAPSAATVRAVEEAYGASGVTEIVVAVSHYETIATLMRTWGAPMPDGVPDPFG
jgi:4-carboxymuconolactone decarboxylase